MELKRLFPLGKSKFLQQAQNVNEILKGPIFFLCMLSTYHTFENLSVLVQPEAAPQDKGLRVNCGTKQVA